MKSLNDNAHLETGGPETFLETAAQITAGQVVGPCTALADRLTRKETVGDGFPRIKVFFVSRGVERLHQTFQHPAVTARISLIAVGNTGKTDHFIGKQQGGVADIGFAAHEKSREHAAAPGMTVGCLSITLTITAGEPWSGFAAGLTPLWV